MHESISALRKQVEVNKFLVTIFTKSVIFVINLINHDSQANFKVKKEWTWILTLNMSTRSFWLILQFNVITQKPRPVA